MVNTIDARMVAKMFLAGAGNLEAHKEWINELNVFPVPDGDTGTNMSMTVMSAAREVSALVKPGMADVAKAVSNGSLRGARGNSGVILSQLFRGFSRTIAEHDEIDAEILADSFEKAVETAYKAVMKPKEGTILTVAKGVSLKATELVEQGETDLEVFFSKIIEEGNLVLSRTPEMLPVLKEAGVVDSGGQGLMTVLMGAYDCFLGKETDFTPVTSGKAAAGAASSEPVDEADIKFGYCTEFIILLNKPFGANDERSFKEFLTSIGDSIVCVADDEIVKTHVHTNDPGLAIQRALTYGALSNMKIDNMRLEHRERVIKMSEVRKAQEEERRLSELKATEEKKKFGFIAVAVGDGIANIFRELGADCVIEGGQTMNPSTEDMLEAIERTNAENIFILPNNKNIILAANQARDLTEDKNIIVVPTKTVPQGISAVINFMPDNDCDENLENMITEISRVRSGQITYAVRDTVIDGREIHQNDYMGIGDEGIVSVDADINRALYDMVDHMIDDDTELISIYYGQDINEEEAVIVRDYIAEHYSGCDVELQEGGQPVYYYMVSAE